MTTQQKESIEQLKKQQSIEETLAMILSVNCDTGSAEGALISVNKFPELIKDLIDFYPQIKANQPEPLVRQKIVEESEKFLKQFWKNREYISEDYHYGYEEGIKKFVEYIKSNFSA